MKQRHLALGFVALAILVAAVLAWRSLATTERAPDVTYTMLNGDSHTMADMRGKVVLVNFWATSCISCVAEMPELVATHQKFRDRGFETVAVAMSYDTPAYVSQFAESRKLPFKVAFDKSGDVARQFGDVRLTPTSFLINQRGEIVKRYMGAPDFEALHALLDGMLKDG